MKAIKMFGYLMKMFIFKKIAKKISMLIGNNKALFFDITLLNARTFKDIPMLII